MLPQRKPTGLPGYDYSQNGAYFITICAAEKQHVFGKVCVGQGLAPAEMKVSRCGKIVAQQIEEICHRYKTVVVDKYIVMPNHVHILLRLLPAPAGASPCPTISDVICAVKSLSVRECRKIGYMGKLFQTSFHDHVIRDERDYQRIWDYIDSNPAKWEEDCYYNE